MIVRKSSNAERGQSAAARNSADKNWEKEGVGKVEKYYREKVKERQIAEEKSKSRVMWLGRHDSGAAMKPFDSIISRKTNGVRCPIERDEAKWAELEKEQLSDCLDINFQHSDIGDG
uniref:Uncharacterized protein n=1 Tax=Globodera rostochiensis TaxID=31243 RepID=A0A914H5Z8_GLORO